MRMERLDVAGMTCSGCVSAVTHALGAVAGVSAVNVSFETGEATVQYDERLATKADLDAAVKGAGYRIEPTREIPVRRSGNTAPQGPAG